MKVTHALSRQALSIITAAVLSVLPCLAQEQRARGLSTEVNIRSEDGQPIKLYDKSYALLIGVSDYTQGWPKLPGTRVDVTAVRAALERHGFQVVTVENPTSVQLEAAYRNFIQQYGQALGNRLLFYFAGHGHTVKQSYGEEMGYIVPVDAPNPNRDPAGFVAKALDMQVMEVFAKRIQAKHALFLFDSCFSGSLFALSRAVPDIIGYKTSRPVRQFITSGSADEVVPDRSIFREQFVSALEGEADENHDGYVTGTELGNYLQDRVVNYSRNAQHPQYGTIRNPNLDKGDFVFALPKSASSASAATGTPPGTQPAVAPAPRLDPAALELALWDAIKNSKDSEDFKDYLTRYPSGQFAGVAQRRITALNSATNAPPLTNAPPPQTNATETAITKPAASATPTKLAATPAEATHVKAPANSYSTSDDVKVGLQAAREAEPQLPILSDAEITNYVNDVGKRLVSAIPEEYQHPEFRYTFKVINQKEVNAFALPGGPIYVNRGMILAARNEGEMAGVMAHELSHVALRHGTAQATKAQKASILNGIGAVAGAIIGGRTGNAVGQGAQAAVGLYFLKFSREYETQADILGAQIMARAGYDPNDLANMFRNVEQQVSGPDFLSNHPNPGNRSERITQEARAIGSVRNPVQSTQAFARVQARLLGGAAETRRETESKQPQNTGRGPVPLPSQSFQTVNPGLYQMQIPSNWQTQNETTFAPAEAVLGDSNVTHGLFVGAVKQQSTELRAASDQMMSELLKANPHLRQEGNYSRMALSGRAALAIRLTGQSPQTGHVEQATVITTMLRDGRLFYMSFIVPQDEANVYDSTFLTILRSVQIKD
jgi:Zn-dependent protease with chaperone function